MDIDQDLLHRFEAGLRPERLEDSRIPAAVLGYGEMSTIFQIQGAEDLAFKRLPIFRDAAAAGAYGGRLRSYCAHLTRAGLHLPPHATAVVHLPPRPAVLYIAQPVMPAQGFMHRRLHESSAVLRARMEAVAAAIQRVWAFNRHQAPAIEVAIDGQLSNWCFPGEDAARVTFVDTGTPIFRLHGEEQLDPEPLLRSAPAWLRWVLRWLFLAEVMNRYYDPRRVFLDLAANLHKEQRPDLIPMALEVLNASGPPRLAPPLTRREVDAYYRQDKIIWQWFLGFRRLDRWIAGRILGRRYEFILPGAIRR
jgi:hypothetical protein